MSGSSPPVPPKIARKTNPGVGDEELDARDASLFAVFTSLYVVVNILQATLIGNPSIYGPIQLRVADCLIALSALFGWPVVGGVAVGGLLTNAYYFLDPIDVIFGPIANLIAALVIMTLRRRQLVACLAGGLPIGLIVGGYLWLFFEPPDILGLSMPAWTAMIVSITLSSWVALAIIGYGLLVIFSRPAVIEPLKSKGLKVLPT